MTNQSLTKPDARAVRDMILARADWILNSSIRAACGYVPQLPPDMYDFTVDMNEQRMVPEMKPLADLLKAVAPVMKLEDDRRAIELERRKEQSDIYEDEAEQILKLCASGHLSVAESTQMIEQRKPMMEMAARTKIIAAMEALQ